MMRAPYNIPEATLKPPHGKTKSRSLTAVRQQRATGFGMTDITLQSLIGNGMHSPANATALKTVTYTFLSGNEFHSWRVSQKSPTLANRAWDTRKKQVPACTSRGQAASRAGGMTTIRTRQRRQGTEMNSPISNRHLIHCTELETELTRTKHPLGIVSNRQFFAFLKLPDRPLNSAPTKTAKADSSHGQSTAGFGMTSKKAKRRGESLRAGSALRMTQKPQSVGRRDTVRDRGTGG